MKCKEISLKLLAVLAVLLCAPLWVAAQTIQVTGTVSDSEGEPIIGASVVPVGQKTGTVTDIDGNFTIRVASTGKLQISFIGYTTEEVAVNGRTSLSVTLREDSKTLNEVVVVGYGQMKRSDLTGAVVSVGADAVKKTVSTSIDQVLQGRAAGVQIQANSGTPGASSSIRIRGINSLNATNQPIFVIDGVVIDGAIDDENSNPLSSINPSDIVSMDILKDASATAIYGSRASNGVIMITTKRGQKGEATVTYDMYLGWQEMSKQYDMLNLREYAAHHNYRAIDMELLTPSSAFVRPDLLGEGTNWQDELFRKAFTMTHNLSVSGGNERTTWAFSGGYLDQDGIAVGSSFERYSLRSNIETQIKQWLRGGVSFSFTESKQKLGTDNETILSALMQQPAVAATSPDGSYDGPEDQWMPENPLGLAEITTNNNKKDNFRFNVFLEAEFCKGLTFKTEFSGDYNFNRYYYYQPDYQFGIKTKDQRDAKWTKTDTRYLSWRNILTYNNRFGKHNVNAMLGQEMSHSNWEQQIGTASGFLTNTTPDLSAGDASSSRTTGVRNNNSLLSFFGRAFYSFDDRYLFTFTLRRDGSSKFAEGKKWGWFPAVALAWRMSQESFLKDVTPINNAKLRLGWGKTGNQNVSDFAYLSLLSFKTTPWGVGALSGNTANPDLTWESTSSYNVGLDLGLLSNRIELVADFYYKKTDNLLLQIQLPSYLGSAGYAAASDPWMNVGSIENKGFELTLNTTNITNREFTWTSNVVFSLNRNKVKSLDTPTASVERTKQVGSTPWLVTKTVVGQPIGQFYGYKVIGRFDKAEDFYYKDAQGNLCEVARPKDKGIDPNQTWIGDYIFENLDGNGYIDDKDRTFIGNPEPKFTWGFGNTFNYKGFDLNIFFTGAYGNKALNMTRMRIEDPRLNSNILRSSLNFARIGVIDPALPDDDYRNLYVVNAGSTNMPAVQRSDANANYRLSDLMVEDASYIRLQNISLGYTLPKAWVRKCYLENVRVYFNAQNIHTWSKYKGLDPEIGALEGDALKMGIDYGRYPSPRIYTFGLNVSF